MHARFLQASYCGHQGMFSSKIIEPAIGGIIPEINDTLCVDLYDFLIENVVIQDK